MKYAARPGLVPVLCALLLCSCDSGAQSAGPAPATDGEAQALADAQAMLDMREAPEAEQPDTSPVEPE